MRSVRGIATFLALMAAWPAAAQQASYSDNAIRIGVLNDRSGPYSDATGEGSAVAVRLAVEDFGGAIDGVPIEVLTGDHQGKPDVGVTIARRWIDNERVDVIVDIANSGVGFAVNALVADRKRILLNNSASSDFVGKACNAYAVQWNYNTYATTNAVATAVMAEPGRDTWFIIAPDYAYGQAQAGDLRRFVEARGGKVVGSVFAPLGAPDFGSYLLQAQSSGAKVIALANSAQDFVNTLKQAREFGIGHDGKQAVVAVTPVNLPELVALGPDPIQGLLFVSTFEWSRTARTRALAKRFLAKMGRLPSQNHAAAYSATHHYLAAIKAGRTDEPTAVMARMKEMRVDDDYAENAKLREDGQLVHDLYLGRAKAPADVKEAGDFLALVRVIPGADLYPPLADSVCPLVRK